jgi:DNA-binding NarL/FixJ family response regulator
MQSTTSAHARPPITVLLVDPYATTRSALAAALSAEPGIALVADAGSREEALTLGRRHQPQVMLVDIAVLGDRGVARLGDLRGTATNMAIVGMALVEGESLRRAVVRHGADGSVPKDAPPSELAAAIRDAAGRPRRLYVVPPGR